MTKRNLRWLAAILALGLSGPTLAQDEASSEEGAGASEGAGAEESAAWKLYAAVHLDQPKLSLTSEELKSRFGAADLDGNMLRLRAGLRLFDWIGVELQLGAGGDEGDEPGKFTVANYMGLFFAPTGVVFETVEISGLVGISSMKAERDNVSETFSGDAYGVNIELPVRTFVESLPDLRLSGGYLIYNDSNNYQTHGAHLGLRYDFNW